MCVLLHSQAKTNGAGGVHGSVEELVEKADGFAEVFPEHKFEVVEILQVCQEIGSLWHTESLLAVSLLSPTGGCCYCIWTS